MVLWFISVDRIKRIWYLSPMRAAKVQASLRIRAVSPEPPLLAHTSSESSETFRQKATSLAPLNIWACAVKMCHDGMLEDTNSLDGSQCGLLYQFLYRSLENIPDRKELSSGLGIQTYYFCVNVNFHSLPYSFSILNEGTVILYSLKHNTTIVIFLACVHT